MGQSWWWVAVAVLVVALLVVVALVLSRRRRAAPSSAVNVEIAAAAAGGAAGAVGAGAVAATRAEVPDTDTADVSSRASSDATVAAEPDEPAAEPDPVPAPEDPAAGSEAGGGAAESAAVPSIPAQREAPRMSRTESEPPDPAGSALAALDTALVGPGGSLTDAAAAVSAATARQGPYPGSLLPAADGTSPSPVHLIKANEGSRRYHTPDSPYYVRTRGDVWFRTAEEAAAAGFTAWDQRG